MDMDLRTQLAEKPHRRYNPLAGEWILVSPHRARRPWQGQIEKSPVSYRAPYVADCYLCPGNPRAGNARNPDYTGTYVFTNDFPALLDEPVMAGPGSENGFFRATGVGGTCRVVCFSPRHDLTLAEMDLEAIGAVVDVWAEQVAELGERYRWVQVFENKGEIMGCSNPHPHGQIWATDYIPNEPSTEDRMQREHLTARDEVLLMSYAQAEEQAEERVVVVNDDWLAVVPWWAMWPFETLVLPRRRQVLLLPDLDVSERRNLASLLKDLLTRYDALFDASFPYTMGWHGAPTGDSSDVHHWQLHAHFYPPLLRSATIKKFMVGFEMLAEAQRDITPEQAAERLRQAGRRSRS